MVKDVFAFVAMGLAGVDDLDGLDDLDAVDLAGFAFTLGLFSFLVESLVAAFTVSGFSLVAVFLLVGLVTRLARVFTFEVVLALDFDPFDADLRGSLVAVLVAGLDEDLVEDLDEDLDEDLVESFLDSFFESFLAEGSADFLVALLNLVNRIGPSGPFNWESSLFSNPFLMAELNKVENAGF